MAEVRQIMRQLHRVIEGECQKLWGNCRTAQVMA